MTDQVPDVLGGPHLRTVAMPRDTNASGAIFGGWTLSQMDLAGGTFAAQRAKGRVATISIDAMRFLRPAASVRKFRAAALTSAKSNTSSGPTHLKRSLSWSRTPMTQSGPGLGPSFRVHSV